MEPSSWIAIYMPIFVVLFIIIPSQRNNIFIANFLRLKRGAKKVSNELLKSCVGKTCTISTGSLGSAYYKVKVLEVIDNWVKVETKGVESLLNSDYIQNIKIIS